MSDYVLGPNHLGQTKSYEVQRGNNFEIFISGIQGSDVITLAVDAFPAMQEANEPISLAYGNREVKVAGKATYEGGSMRLKDFIDADTAGLIALWRLKVYDPTTDAIGFASDYKKTATLVEFSPDGSIARSWQMTGVWPQTVTYGEHDYSSAEKKTIDVTLAWDLMIRNDS